MITKELIEKSSSYETYRKLLEHLVEQGKTTGEDQKQSRIEYTKLNLQRMLRVEKTLMLDPRPKTVFSNIRTEFFWIVITEGWCGDAAHSLPVMNGLCSLNQRLKLRILLRDENPELMDQYLTNGTRSIPKLICVTDDLREKFTWGPRPLPLQALAMQLIRDKISKDEKGLILQKWYNSDQTKTIQQEFCFLAETHMCS